MRLKTSLALLLTLGLLAAGCGGDDETTSSTTTEATGASGASGASGESGAAGILPADFAAEADAICKDAEPDLEAAFGNLGQGKPSAGALDDAVSALVASIQGQIDDIRALGAPEEGAEELTQFLDDAESALSEIESDPQSLLSGDDPFADVNKQGLALGLETCGG